MKDNAGLLELQKNPGPAEGSPRPGVMKILFCFYHEAGTWDDDGPGGRFQAQSDWRQQCEPG
jgi:hypothetical protein